LKTVTKLEKKFLELFSLDVNDKVEKKKTGSTELSYLSWAWAWAEFCKAYPNATYEIIKDNGKPYFSDESGAMCYTVVDNGNGLKHEMWLPVMDGANNAMKNKSYTYKVKKYEWNKETKRKEFIGNYDEKTVESYTMFDVNKTLMRCLVKNLAMFGLGLYIYAGEDLPQEMEETEEQKKIREAEELKLLEKQKADELALHGKLVHDLNALMGDNTDMFEKSIIKMNKTFKTEYKGFGEFNNVQLQQYINYLNKQKESK